MDSSSQSGNKNTVLKNRLQAWTLALLIIVLIPIVYGYLYIQERDNYITSLYFRSLSEIDHQINLGLKGLDHVLDFSLNENNEDTRFLCELGDFYESYSKVNFCNDYKDYFSKYSQSFKNIRFFEDTTTGNALNNQSDENNTPDTSETDEKNKSNSGKASDKTYFDVTGVLNNRKISVYQPPKKLAAKLPLKDLIDPAPALKYFNEILLLDKQGNVLYRSGQDYISRIGNYDALDDFARFENLIHYLYTDTTVEWDQSSKAFKVKKVSRLPSHSTVREATIGSISYKLFVQPFHAVREQITITDEKNTAPNGQVTLSEFKADKLAYLVGIVSKKKHFLDITSLSLGQVTVLLFFVVFIILLIPHFKLEFSGPQFMPSRALAASLAISIPLLVVLLVIGGLATRDYIQLRQGLNETAKTIAIKIKKTFELEFGNLQNIDVWPTEVEEVCPKQVENNPRYTFEYYNPKDKDKIGHGLIMRNANPNWYPSFELSFLIDRDGKQTGKQVFYRKFPSAPPIKVAKREYFKQPYFHPESLSSWQVKDKKYQAFYSERIQTYDQGMKLTALSRPLADTDQSCMKSEDASEDKPPKVQALIKLMHTFFQPVLPFGYGFAVIKDISGEVIYHSNDQRSLLENFYIETDQNDRLIAAVQSRHEQSINGIYNGVHHGFWLTPIDHTSWTLILFYDASIMELAHLKGWVFSFFFAATWLIIAPFFVLYLIYPKLSERLIYFAPHGQFGISLRGHSSFASKHFKAIYPFIVEMFIVVIFSLATWVIYNSQFSKQMEGLSKLNLVSVGHQLFNRKNALTLETSRLMTLDDTNKTDEVKYIDENCKLRDFALYADSASSCIVHNSDLVNTPWIVTINHIEETFDKKDTPYPRADVEEGLPLLSRLDAKHRLMMYNHASDLSWFFSKPEASKITSHMLNNKNQKHLMITGSLNPSKNDLPSGDLKNLLMFFYPVAALFLIFNLIRLISRRLMGLRFPQREKWRNYFTLYQSVPILKLAPSIPKNDDSDLLNILTERNLIAERNLKKIVSGTTEPLLELKAILFHRSRNRLINTDNRDSLMWLILGGLFQYKSGGIDFSNIEMKRWVREQNWTKQINHFEANLRNDLWRIMAPAFYATLLIVIGYLILSGGHIVELVISLLPVALAGGYPFISQVFEKFTRK